MDRKSFWRLAVAALVVMMLFSPKRVSAQQETNALLWEISGNGLEEPSYLFGTMHVNDSLAFQFGDSLLATLRACETVAGELLFNELDYLASMKAFFMEDTSLKDLLAPDDYKLVSDYLNKHLGLVALMFKIDHIKPIFLTTLLQEFEGKDIKELLSENPDNSPVLDQFLQNMGVLYGKEVYGLETADEQLASLDEVSPKEQAEMLLGYVKANNKGGGIMKIMLDLYIAQDMNGMVGFYGNSKGEGLPPSFDEHVLLKRNHRMLGRMDTMIRRQASFVAVGALHLPGEEGLLRLLKQKGYELRPVALESGEGVPSLTAKWRWFPFDAPGGVYKVEFPGIPTPVNSEETGEENVYQCRFPDLGKEFATISVDLLPSGYEAAMDTTLLLGAASTTGSEVPEGRGEMEWVQLGGVTGVKGIVLDEDGDWLLYRYYITQGRLVCLLVSCKPEDADDGDIARFFGSLQFRE